MVLTSMAPEGAVILSDFPLGQIDYEDLPFIHHLSDAKGVFWLSDNVSQGRASEKLADFVQDGRDGFRAQPSRVFIKLIGPELPDLGLVKISQNVLPELLIG